MLGLGARDPIMARHSSPAQYTRPPFTSPLASSKSPFKSGADGWLSPPQVFFHSLHHSRSSAWSQG